MERKKVVRRSYFIKRKLQWKILASVIGMLVSFTLFLVLGLYFPLFYILYSNLPGESVTLQQTAYFYLSIEKYIWISILMVMALIGVYSIILSHRIAGPLYRFERTLQGIGQGDLSQRIQLRRYDELKDFGDQLNQTLDALEANLRRAHRAVEETERAQSILLALYQSQGLQSRQIEDQLLGLRDSVSHLREALSHFRLSSSPSPEIPPR